VNASFNTNSIIFIYDRYGKLIKLTLIAMAGMVLLMKSTFLMIIGFAKLQDGREKLRDTSA
jgi:hypothetical protein